MNVALDDGYNGWSNYATWSVALIVDNDEQLYEHRRAIVRAAGPDKWDVGIALEDWLRREADRDVLPQDRRPLSLLWGQLLTAALLEVDWNELAEAWTEEES